MSIRKAAKQQKVDLKEVEIKSLGEKAYFRRMSAKDYVTLLDWNLSQSEEKRGTLEHELEWKARMIALCLHDKDGNLEYSQSKDDVEEIMNMQPDAIGELYITPAQFLGLGQAEGEEEAISEAEAERKN